MTIYDSHISFLGAAVDITVHLNTNTISGGYMVDLTKFYPSGKPTVMTLGWGTQFYVHWSWQCDPSEVRNVCIQWQHSMRH